MYQRVVIAPKSVALSAAVAKSAADAKKESDNETHNLIRNKKEHRSDDHHGEYRGGGNGRLTARRPSYLLGGPVQEKMRNGHHDDPHGRFAVPEIGHSRKVRQSLAADAEEESDDKAHNLIRNE